MIVWEVKDWNPVCRYGIVSLAVLGGRDKVTGKHTWLWVLIFNCPMFSHDTHEERQKGGCLLTTGWRLRTLGFDVFCWRTTKYRQWSGRRKKPNRFLQMNVNDNKRNQQDTVNGTEKKWTRHSPHYNYSLYSVCISVICPFLLVLWGFDVLLTMLGKGLNRPTQRELKFSSQYFLCRIHFDLFNNQQENTVLS